MIMIFLLIFLFLLGVGMCCILYEMIKVYPIISSYIAPEQAVNILIFMLIIIVISLYFSGAVIILIDIL